MHSVLTRRDFLERAGALGATWILAGSAIDGGAEGVHPPAVAGSTAATFFTPSELREMSALAGRIIPSDDGDGAREAGAVHFIDRGLASFARDQQAIFRQGLTDLAHRAAAAHSGAARFSALTAAQQDALLHTIEKTPFFQAALVATVSGMLCLPSYGGNRGYIGWKAIGLEPGPTFRPPFGYYDQPDVRRQLLGGDDA